MADNKPCPDCGVEVGQPHDDGCDVARCLWDGSQRIQCDKSLAADCCRALVKMGEKDLADDLAHYLSLDDPDHDCGREVWTGEWPGDADAAALGWFIYWGPDFGERGWVSCAPDHPGASPDLNRLAVDARWDRETCHWLAREEQG